MSGAGAAVRIELAIAEGRSGKDAWWDGGGGPMRASRRLELPS